MSRVRLASLLVLLSGCLATAAPRLPADVAASLHARPMRRLETQSLRLYYPEGRQDEARRVAERLEGCIAGLRMRTVIKSNLAEAKMTVLLPEVPFNNAFVATPAPGYTPLSVIPALNTWDFQTEMGLPPDPSWIGCHELVHFVQAQQMGGAWGAVTRVFGDVLTPQLGFDPWFWEGLATSYESRFQPGTGRMASPVWRGFFHAAVAGRGISGGDLSEWNRRFHFANHYLYGSWFVDFLIERHGERKLWELISDQGTSIVFFLFLSPRFYFVYGKSLSTLIDDFEGWAERRFPVVARPTTQKTVRELGEDARWARAAGGREAFVIGHADAPTELLVVEADGRVLRRRRLNELVPPRRVAGAVPLLVSGLSFTADGGNLYFAAITRGPVEQEVRLFCYDIDGDRLRVVHTLTGPGGGLSTDDKRYYYAHAEGDRHDLAMLDLATGQRSWVALNRERQYVSDAREAPDGRHVAMTFFDGQRFVVRVVPVAGGAPTDFAVGAQTAQPAWLDADELVFLGEQAGKYQVFHAHLGGEPRVVSAAPYLAFAPLPAGPGKVRFMNRQGMAYSLDEIDLTASAPAAAPAAPPPVVPAIRADLVVVSDEPYAWYDHLFYPQLRSILVSPISTNTSKDIAYGFTVGGADRLEMHRWALSLAYQADPGELSYRFDYAMSRFAPWYLVLSLSELRWAKHGKEPANPPDGFEAEVVETDRQRVFQLIAARAWGGLDVAVNASWVEDEEHDTLPTVMDEDVRLAGAGLSFGYAAADGSRHTGAQYLLAARAAGDVYPEAWTSLDEDFADLRGQLAGRLPLPLGGRVGLALRAHALAGLEDRDDLQVGGQSGLLAIYRSHELPDDVEPLDFPDSVRFYEPLRAFSDLRFHTDRIAITDLTLTWPIVIDHGWASSLFLFPPVFVRQLEVELFAVAASDGRDAPPMQDSLHAAAGGALTLRTSFWRIPLDITYQVARRLSDDEELVQEVGLAVTLTAE